MEAGGIDAWYDIDQKELLGADADQYEKVMDTWMSGLIPVSPTTLF